MKRMIFAACAVALTATASNAADLKGGDNSLYQYTQDWGMEYVGIHAGWSNNDFGRVVGADDHDNYVDELYSSEDWSFGAQFGVQKQVGRVVVGMDVSATWLDSIAAVTVGDVEHSTAVDWMATLRARMGLPINDRIMPYVAGGVAIADVTETATMGDFTAELPNDIRFGWVVGAGIDVKLGEDFMLNIDYSRVYFDDSVINATANGQGGSFNASVDVDVVKVGLSRRL